MFRRGIFGSSERGLEERGADVQRCKLVRSYASSVRAQPNPGDRQPADERVAAATAAVKRQYRPRTRTYIPCVETPSSVIILRLIDFLRSTRDTRAYLGRPSIVVRQHARSMVAPTREIAEKREKTEREKEKDENEKRKKRRHVERRDTHDTHERQRHINYN